MCSKLIRTLHTSTPSHPTSIHPFTLHTFVLAPPHTGSLCSGLFRAAALGVSCSAPNLRDYVRTHHHHRKPPLSPGSLPCQIGMFGMFTQLSSFLHKSGDFFFILFEKAYNCSGFFISLLSPLSFSCVDFGDIFFVLFFESSLPFLSNCLSVSSQAISSYCITLLQRFIPR